MTDFHAQDRNMTKSEILNRLAKILEEVHRGETIYRGSFAKYAEEIKCLGHDDSWCANCKFDTCRCEFLKDSQ